MKEKVIFLSVFLILSSLFLNAQNVEKRIKEIRKAYYEAKNADTSEDVPHRNFSFTLDAGPDIPAIGWYSADFEYNMITGLVTGKVVRAAYTSEYYEFLFIDGELAFAYEKVYYDESQEEIRMYFDNGKIIKKYTKDKDGNVSKDASLDIDYKLITNIVKNLDALFNSSCGCSNYEDSE